MFMNNEMNGLGMCMGCTKKFIESEGVQNMSFVKMTF